MQRETKIGLLVGTGVIVLIGILLSDHLSSAHRQGQADLGQTTPPELSMPISPPPIEMNEGSVAVAIDGAERSESWTGPTRLPNDVQAATSVTETPRQSNQVNQTAQPDVLVLGGEPSDDGYSTYSNYRELDVNLPSGRTVAMGPSPSLGQLVEEEETDGLVSWPPPGFIEMTSERYGSARPIGDVVDNRRAEPLVQPRPITTNSGGQGRGSAIGGQNTRTNTHQVSDNRQESASSRGVTHHVEKGETLSDISTKYYGTVKKVNLIVEANRDKIPDPNRIRFGVRLVIPDVPEEVVASGSGSTGSGSTGSSSGNIQPAAGNEPTATPAEAATTTYKVKSGDSLAKIAERFYGSQTAWPKLHALNKSTLPDPNRLRAGMTLIVPSDRG